MKKMFLSSILFVLLSCNQLTYDERKPNGPVSKDKEEEVHNIRQKPRSNSKPIPDEVWTKIQWDYKAHLIEKRDALVLAIRDSRIKANEEIELIFNARTIGYTNGDKKENRQNVATIKNLTYEKFLNSLNAVIASFPDRDDITIKEDSDTYNNDVTIRKNTVSSPDSLPLARELGGLLHHLNSSNGVELDYNKGYGFTPFYYTTTVNGFFDNNLRYIHGCNIDNIKRVGTEYSNANGREEIVVGCEETGLFGSSTRLTMYVKPNGMSSDFKGDELKQRWKYSESWGGLKDKNSKYWEIIMRYAVYKNYFGATHKATCIIYKGDLIKGPDYTFFRPQYIRINGGQPSREFDQNGYEGNRVYNADEDYRRNNNLIVNGIPNNELCDFNIQDAKQRRADGSIEHNRYHMHTDEQYIDSWNETHNPSEDEIDTIYIVERNAENKLFINSQFAEIIWKRNLIAGDYSHHNPAPYTESWDEFDSYEKEYQFGIKKYELWLNSDDTFKDMLRYHDPLQTMDANCNTETHRDCIINKIKPENKEAIATLVDYMYANAPNGIIKTNKGRIVTKEQLTSEHGIREIVILDSTMRNGFLVAEDVTFDDKTIQYMIYMDQNYFDVANRNDGVSSLIYELVTNSYINKEIYVNGYCIEHSTEDICKI